MSDAPVRSGHAQSFTQPHPQAQQRKSMPPPSPRSQYPGQPWSTHSSVSSRLSPALSQHSAEVRVNMQIPSRQTSADSAWDERLKTPKETWPETPREQSIAQVAVQDAVEAQFDHLLESLQVPASVREKFTTVSSGVKSSILSSTMTSNPTILSSLGLPPSTKDTPKVKKRMSAPRLRKAKSSSSVGSPGPNPEVGKTYSVEGNQFTIVASPLSSPIIGLPSPSFSLRGQSMDMSRPPNSRQSTGPARPMSMSLFGPSSSSSCIPSTSKSGGKGLGINMGEQPESFILWLGSYKGTDLRLEVGRCKKMRMLLRHESTTWVAAFLEMGGYKLVLARLQDVLDMEWREEQHDDQMLYELLRCVKALSTSEIGKSALRAHFPVPFPALSTLLFSEKKPGDLPSRQIIVELWLFLFGLFPPVSSRNPASRPTSVRFDTEPVDITATIRSLLAPELPDPTKEQHEFITAAHRPRVFKAWVGELSDICRDYFWVMCHGSNTLWALDEVDEDLVEKPVAPGGATGGVEFEAMNYVTTHFKLLNTLCKYQARADRSKATQLHHDLLTSGMDRILVTLRKASTTYYPSLHLELARYVSLLRAASPNARLPHLIDKLVGSAPEEVRKRHAIGGWLPMPIPQVATDGGRRGAWDVQSSPRVGTRK